MSRLSQSLIVNPCQLDQKHSQHVDMSECCDSANDLCFDFICLLLVTYMTSVEHLIGDFPSKCTIGVSELPDQEDEMGVD